MTQYAFTVVAAVNNRKVLEQNLLRSPGLAEGCPHQLLIKEGYRSASAAYDSGMGAASNDIVVFVHQDVYLPAAWFDQLTASLEALDRKRQPWGVLGCFGTRKDCNGLGRVYSTGWGLQGTELQQPEPVDTLDEIVLIVRQSSGLRFDTALPYFHMYGVDICLSARHAGLPCFAIPAFCVHNTNQLLKLPGDFYECYWWIKAKWSAYLPIYTSCITISRFDLPLRRRKLEELLAGLRRVKRVPAKRIEDPRAALAGLNT